MPYDNQKLSEEDSNRDDSSENSKDSENIRKEIKLRTNRLKEKLLKFNEKILGGIVEDNDSSSNQRSCPANVNKGDVRNINVNRYGSTSKCSEFEPVTHSLDKKNEMPKCSRSRTRSERSHRNKSEISEIKRSQSFTMPTYNPNLDINNVSNSKPKRSRGKRREKKLKKKYEVIKPFYDIDIKNLQLNAETFLILDLLGMPFKEREEYLIELAKKRKVLIENTVTKNLEINPKIKRLGFILRNGQGLYEMNDQKINCIEQIIDAESVKLSKKSKEKHKVIEKPPKRFEDFVNEIVLETLNKKQIAEFTFPYTSKQEQVINYYNTEEFNTRLEDFAQKCVNAKLGIIIEGEVRVNAKNNDQAFIKNITGERDAMFPSQIARKNALQGDIVRAFVRLDTKPKENNEVSGDTTISVDLQDENDIVLVDISDETVDMVEEELMSMQSAKAFVIKIVTEVHSRKCVGSFLSFRKNSDYIAFTPRDMRMPNIRIQKEDWPSNFTQEKLENITDTMYVAIIKEWKNDLAIGKILEPIGKCGELESENKAILLQNSLNMDPFEERFNEMFEETFTIPNEEFEKREDIREECVFTIDPLTARDLDDAMSCKELSDGNTEVAVHISDVAYFLEENSELDDIVKMRNTSVYMVNEVFHMLPKPLCFRCSLLPAEDKLAFTVFWIINPTGEIVRTRFARTIINSCTQFAYEHAQKIIDNPNKIFTENDFPQIHNNFTIDNIITKVKKLNSIAILFRKKRFDNGALKINRPKIYFELDPATGKPITYEVCELKSANFLIEEFMLLANQSVAKFIHDRFPKISILRNHMPPIKNVITSLRDRLEKIGLKLDIQSSKSIQESMYRLIENSENPDAMSICLSQLVSKPMNRARYFCSEGFDDTKEFWHYALSIPIYTHFTSPIRRYPDVLVHRVLSAALNYTDPPKRTPHELHSLAAICNDKKYNAKLAGDDSSNLYFLHYVESKKSIIMKAAVVEVFRYCCEVILIETGHQFRISFRIDKNNMKVIVNEDIDPRTAFLTIVDSENLSEIIELKTFSLVWVEIYVCKGKLKAKFTSNRLPIVNI